jgi:hypothetical protein
MAKEKQEYDYEGDMAMSQLKSIMVNAKRLHDKLKPDTNLPEWVQSKITLAQDYVQTASNYVETEMSESMNTPYVKQTKDASGNPAWKASNKHGKVKFFGGEFKSSANKHAGIQEVQESILDRFKKKPNAESSGHEKMNQRVSAMSDAELKQELADHKRRTSKATSQGSLVGGAIKDYVNTLQKHIDKRARVNEDAPANAVGSGNIAGVGVGPQGEPGIRRKAMDKYKSANASQAPKAGRKTFTQFMKNM